MKKKLNEELVRISELMGVKPRLELLVESPKPIGDLLLGLWKKINDEVGSAEFDIVKRGDAPVINGKKVTVADFQQLKDTLKSLKTRIDSLTNTDTAWDDFLTSLSDENKDLISKILRKDKLFVAEVYNKLMKQRIDSVNEKIREYIANGVTHPGGPKSGQPYDEKDLIYSEEDLIERISGTMTRTSKTLRRTLQEYGFDSVTVDILEDAITPKLDSFTKGAKEEFRKLVNGNFTLNELGNKSGQEFNPDLWQIDWDNFRLNGVSADEMEELIRIVDQSFVDKMFGNLNNMQERAKSMRLLFQQLNDLNSKNITSETEELIQNIYKAFESQFKRFYENETEMFNKIKKFLNDATNSGKIDQDSPLKKLVDELNKNVTNEGKIWAFSLVDDKIRTALKAIKDGFSGVDFKQVYKLPLKVFTYYPLKGLDTGLDLVFTKYTKKDWLDKYENFLGDSYFKENPDASKWVDFLANNPKGSSRDGYKIGIFGNTLSGNNKLPYWGQKYFSGGGGGASKYAQLEFISRSLAKLIRYKIQMTFLEAFYGTIVSLYNSQDVEPCRDKMMELAEEHGIELDPDMDFAQILFSGVLSGTGIYETLECQNVKNSFDLLALKMMGTDSESYAVLTNSFVSAFMNNWPTTLGGIGKTLLQTFVLPGLADEIGLKCIEVWQETITKRHGIRDFSDGIRKRLNELGKKADDAAKEVEKAADKVAEENPELRIDLDVNRDSTTTNTETTPIISGDEKGFKQYLSKIKKDTTSVSVSPASGGKPPKGMDGDDMEYEFINNQWSPIF